MNLASFSSPRMLARNYVAIGLVFGVLGYGLIFIMKWCLSPTSDAYTKLEAMHGTIIVFFGIVPIVFVGLGYGLMPLGRGGKMFFPRLDRVALILFYLSAILVLVSLFLPERLIFLLAMFLNIASALACSVNFIATIIYLRKTALNWIQMQSLVWTLFVTAFLVLLNFVLLEYAASMQLADTLFGNNFWLPASRFASEQSVPIFWRHFFWFAGHPEVYILLLAIVGALADSLRLLSRKFR